MTGTSNQSAHSRVATGTDPLDTILKGGLTPDRLYLVVGDPGTGKTTLALQFLLEGVKRGERVLYVTLSETREELEGMAASHGWPLEGIELFELIPSEESLLTDTHSRMFHPSEVELNETTRSVLAEVERINPSRVVFDSLSEMRLLAQSPLRYRRQILGLKQFFIGRQCTVLLLDDGTSETNDCELYSLAHGVILLEHIAHDFGADRRRLRIVKMRGSDFAGGYHDFKIRAGGLQVFPRLIAADHRHPFKPGVLKSGLPGLDRLLGGGLDYGTSTLLMGPAGSGKSTLATVYAAAAAMAGEKAALFAFDESRSTLLSRSAGLGMNLDGVIASGQLHVQQIDPAELTPGEFSNLMLKATLEGGARVVVIDSLNGYMNAMPEERFLSIQLHELLMFLGQQGVVTILVVAQHGLIGTAMESPIDASYLADSVILFRYYEFQGMLKRAISVIKKRSGRHEDLIREFRMTSGGVVIGDPLDRLQGILTGVPSFPQAAPGKSP